MSSSFIFLFYWVNSHSSVQAFPFLSNKSFTRNAETTTKLNYFNSDESLGERLKRLESSFTNLKVEDIPKIIAKEVNEAEKNLVDSFSSAEKYAEEVIARGKQGGTTELLDDMEAAKMLESAAENSIANDLLVEKDLETMAENVASNIKEAEKIVQSIAEKGTQDEIENNALQLSTLNIQNSVKAADSVVETVESIVTKDELEIVKLESTGKELVEVIEQAKSPASDGIEDKIVVSIDNAATDVVKELEAVENVAESIVKKVENDATSLASLDTTAADVIDALKVVEAAVKESSDNPEALRKVAATALESIESDINLAEKIVATIKADFEDEEAAISVLQNADKNVDTLLKAVQETLENAGTVDTIQNKAAVVAEAVESMNGVVTQNIAEAVVNLQLLL